MSAAVITLTLSTGESTRSLVESENGRFAETDLTCPACARDLRVRGEMTGHDFDTDPEPLYTIRAAGYLACLDSDDVGLIQDSDKAWHDCTWSYVSTDECSVSSLECDTIPREALEALADELQRVTGAETRRSIP